MPREIVWLPEAARDVVRLRTFIQEKNPQAAQRAASRIKEAVQILNENPEAGRPVEEVLSFRDLIIPFGSGNYILRYREGLDRVVIVRVRHSKKEGF
jgi:plasmid stabilization system protein ParE